MWTLSKDERRSAKASGEAEKATGRCFSIKSQVKSNGCATILFCRRQVKKNLIPKRQLSCHKKEQTPKDAKIGPNTFFPLNRVQSVAFCGNFCRDFMAFDACSYFCAAKFYRGEEICRYLIGICRYVGFISLPLFAHAALALMVEVGDLGR